MTKLRPKQIVTLLEAGFEPYKASARIFDYGDKLELTITLPDGSQRNGVFSARDCKNREFVDSLIRTHRRDLGLPILPPSPPAA